MPAAEHINGPFDRSSFVLYMTEVLNGTTLAEADETIDAMRRCVYAARFTGEDMAAVRAHLMPSERALIGISIVQDMPIFELEATLLELRYHVWESTLNTSLSAFADSAAPGDPPAPSTIRTPFRRVEAAMAKAVGGWRGLSRSGRL